MAAGREAQNHRSAAGTKLVSRKVETRLSSSEAKGNAEKLQLAGGRTGGHEGEGWYLPPYPASCLLKG